MAMSTLSQRLQRVQEPVSDPEFDFSHLSMEQLDNYKIKFGKTHVGKTFSQMWRQEQKWILWFAQHYSKSHKWDHRVFLYYVDKKVERCELSGSKIPATSSTEIPAATSPRQISTAQICGAQPKERTMPAPRSEMPADVWDLEEEDPELFGTVPETSEPELVPQIEPVMPTLTASILESRMQQVENVLNKIVNYIEQNTTTLINEQ